MSMSAQGIVLDNSISTSKIQNGAVTRIKTTGISYTTQTLGGRAFDTVYHNTGSTPRFVVISCSTQNLDSRLEIYTDPSNPPTTRVSQTGAIGTISSSYVIQSSFIVLPGNYYKAKIVGGTAPTLYDWTEWD